MLYTRRSGSHVVDRVPELRVSVSILQEKRLLGRESVRHRFNISGKTEILQSQ